MIKDLLSRLNITLPDAETEVLQSHHLKQNNTTFYLRLMDIEEIMEVTDFMSEMDVFQDIVPLWADDHSNYIGIYVQGTCKNKVCYLNHEETDLSPGFRSISTFVSELESHPDLDWHELKKEYPADIDSDPNLLEEDLNCISDLNNLINSNNQITDEMRCQYIYSIMVLTPKTQLDSIVKYLDDEDKYVQERACEIIGYHKYAPAKDKLVEISKSGMHNGKIAAKKALARIR
ncbi:HEAT repeat domain-containing protein [Paenibacillus sp. HJL G12]|uniref:HEAT repeat domain-containing protein n=1 Tax=Paenibacillus dendrobii TaxID=2691084 RepID=A0A7X3IIU6_9BACL|nr:SMI1/KNR4 family protein [Paenibacillus dendrobii]MWV43380.1 HEAT repeat domain-containing protein [Paenibacillus dendrobii]